ncbi:MAG: right-handed parallel beta-helix repeat-containing protein [Desulfocapsa sp.]|nr:right-handed parallel beta-helix repeat-containing protein [Desulfocapsa sp.]
MKIMLSILCSAIVMLFAFSTMAANKVVVVPLNTSGKIVGTEIVSLPYTISASGFYCITKNLKASSNGIIVAANDVTIDLLGFTITGPGKSSGENHGVRIEGRSNVEIRNGTIANFGKNAVYENSTDGKNHRVLNMRLLNNGHNGISLNGWNHAVKECTVADNGFIGIWGGNGAIISGNNVYNNANHGMYVSRSLVINNLSFNNGMMNIAPVTSDNTITENHTSP